MSPASTSPVTLASARFVAEHLDSARALGESLPALVGEPEAFAAALRAGFASLGDPVYAAGVRSVTPGLGPVFGVRQPLMTAAFRAYKSGTRKTPAAPQLACVDRLFGEEQRELRWFGIWMLGRVLPADPEGTWQLLRRAATFADEWISVDTLAHPYAEGIVRDRARWPELDRLSYSPSRWERRLVGSTLAVMAHVNFPGGFDPLVVRHGLELIGQLIGDNEPDVQKALSWALRDFTRVSPNEVKALLDEEVLIARRTRDGNRAWVIKDAMTKLPDEVERYRQILEGVRRVPGAPSTSRASTATTDLGSTAP